MQGQERVCGGLVAREPACHVRGTIMFGLLDLCVVYLSSIYLSLSLYLSNLYHIYLSLYLSSIISIYLSICLSIYLLTYLSSPICFVLFLRVGMLHMRGEARKNSGDQFSGGLESHV